MSTLTRNRNRSGRRGYTVVEVLATMTLFAIGAAGVVSMQRVTIQGGDDARRFDIGTNIANEWDARLQRDSMSWTLPSADQPTTSNLPNATKFLKDILVAGVEDTWHNPALPSTADQADSPAYDIVGHELVAGSGDHVFCVQTRLHWVSNAPPVGPWTGMLMRAEIRVVWGRLETALIGDCSALPAAPDPTKYHFVYVTTALRPNPAK